MTAAEQAIGADWKVGDRLFHVRYKGRGGHPDEGYFVTLTAATPARVRAGNLTWTRDGRAYGGDYSQGSLRAIQDGDEALDAAWRARAVAEEQARRHAYRAERLVWVGRSDWRKLSAEQVDTIHGWLAAAGVKA